MSDPHPQASTLSYASPPTLPELNSGYAVGALVVAAVVALWKWAVVVGGRPFVFDVYKESSVLAAGGLLAFLMSIASYLQPDRRRTVSHVAITVSFVVLGAALVLWPL